MNIKKKNSILLMIILGLLIIIILLASYLVSPIKFNSNQIIIIPLNSSTKDIAYKLHMQGLIKLPSLFSYIAKIYSLKSYLKSGEYNLGTNISPLNILTILSSGKSIIHKITIPEGSTVAEIVQKINEEDRLLGDPIELAKIIEGSLMPATYYYSYGDKKYYILNQMQRLMEKNLNIIWQQLSENSPLKSKKDILILASIVEKESALEIEKPMIAAAFLNRLKIKMKLQADPTTIYAITLGKFKLMRPLTTKDLALQSPYNTYYIEGLPSGAISCPGYSSLLAVTNPATTNALYFVANHQGGHNFTDNLLQHIKNVNSYRQGLNK